MRTADYKNKDRPYREQQNLREIVNRLSPSADGEVLVGTGADTAAWESGATLRTSLGLGTGDSPQFTAIELGHASDTTLTRKSAGVMDVEGNAVPSIASVVAGDIIYASGTQIWARLAKGTDGQVLTLASGVPSWAAGATVPADGCAFSITGSQANDSGDDTTFQSLSAHVSSEVFDLGTDVAGGTFTAPATAKYQLQGFIALDVNDEGGIDDAEIAIVTSNRTYLSGWDNASSGADAGAQLSISVLADMDASDTATLQWRVDGLAGDVWDVDAFYFSGFQVTSDGV